MVQSINNMGMMKKTNRAALMQLGLAAAMMQPDINNLWEEEERESARHGFRIGSMHGRKLSGGSQDRKTIARRKRNKAARKSRKRNRR